MTLKEHFRILGRGVKKILQMEKCYTICLMLSAFLDSVVVYIPVYFSAKVIDTLISGASLQEILTYAALTVGLVFAVKLIGAFISSARDVHLNALYRNEDWAYSEKAMQMAYSSIEDPEVTRLRERIRRESQTGFNLFYLTRGLEQSIYNAVKIAASVAMTISFFTLPSVSFWLKLALMAGLGLTLFVSMRATAKMAALNQRLMADSVEMNILSISFDKYTSESMSVS